MLGAGYFLFEPVVEVERSANEAGGSGAVAVLIDGFFGSAGQETFEVTGGDFTVVPEPGTAVLITTGIALLGAISRRAAIARR